MDKDKLIDVMARALSQYKYVGQLSYAGQARTALEAINDAGVALVPNKPTDEISGYLIDNSEPIGCCSISTFKGAEDQYEGFIKAGEIK